MKLDGDVVFQPEVLRRLFAAAGDGRIVLDDRCPPREEAMKVEAPAGEPKGVLRFGKGLDPARCSGESIGIEWFSATHRAALQRAVAAAVAAGQTQLYYEEVYSTLVAEGLALNTVAVGDLAWTEVDDHDDLARARALVASWQIAPPAP
jgi:choline kinase